jgi:hypothetical protein
MPRQPLFAMACVAFVLALARTALAADEDVSSVTGSISVSPGEHRGDLSTVNGSIRIGEGATTGRAHTVNGSIMLASRASAAEARTVNGSVHLEDGAKVNGGVTTVNGSLNLEKGADVSGALGNVNGGIHVNAAHVGGDVDTVNGGIEIGPDARIDGGITVRKSHSNETASREEPLRVVIGPGSVVKGPMKFERPVKLYVSDRASIGAIEGATAISFSGPRPPE